MNQALLVNDNVEIRDRTAAMLVDMGWDVYVANSENLVFKTTVARRPDILIADIEMKGGVGFEAISTARRLFKSLFIIAVTRGIDEELWSEIATEFGANSYIVGPISTTKLAAAIHAGFDNGLLAVELLPTSSRQSH